MLERGKGLIFTRENQLQALISRNKIKTQKFFMDHSDCHRHFYNGKMYSVKYSVGRTVNKLLFTQYNITY